MFLLIGMLIGLVLGLTGAGGSVFAVPLLILLGGMSVHGAVGLSLGAVAISALYGSVRSWHSDLVLWPPTLILALSGALVAPLGKWLGNQLPDVLLLVSFNVLTLIIAVRMWRDAQRNPERAQVVRASRARHRRPEMLCMLGPNGQFELKLRCISGLAIGGALVGLLSGVFGVGGGFLIIPLLLFLSRLSMVQAVSISLLIITLISSSGFISHWLFTEQAGTPMDWSLLGWLALGGVGGMVVGQQISHRIANARLQQIFAVGLVLLALVTLASTLIR